MAQGFSEFELIAIDRKAQELTARFAASLLCADLADDVRALTARLREIDAAVKR